MNKNKISFPYTYLLIAEEFCHTAQYWSAIDL